MSTRIDHVHYVASIGRIIAEFLGLNGELTEAIALGHDLGHTPFGHDGEGVIRNIMISQGMAVPGTQPFWHGKNGLRYVDDLELLAGPDGKVHNLDLTYAVRDGIIAHSGDVMGEALYPREAAVDLNAFCHPGQYNPYTWEGCIIKLADNISYLGRDIDDALLLGIMDDHQHRALSEIVRNYARGHGDDPSDINNANVIHLMVTDLCENSTPEKGLCFSAEASCAMAAVMDMNRQYIYHHPRLRGYKDYGELIIKTVFESLLTLCGNGDLEPQLPYYMAQYPVLTTGFCDWLANYWDRTDRNTPGCSLANHLVYITKEEAALPVLKQAIVDYLSGMTDRFIEKVYREQISF